MIFCKVSKVLIGRLLRVFGGYQAVVKRLCMIARVFWAVAKAIAKMFGVAVWVVARVFWLETWND